MGDSIWDQLPNFLLSQVIFETEMALVLDRETDPIEEALGLYAKFGFQHSETAALERRCDQALALIYRPAENLKSQQVSSTTCSSESLRDNLQKFIRY